MKATGIRPRLFAPANGNFPIALAPHSSFPISSNLGVRSTPVPIHPKRFRLQFGSHCPTSRFELLHCTFLGCGMQKSSTAFLSSLSILTDSDLHPSLHYLSTNHCPPHFHTCQIKKESSVGNDDLIVLSIDGHMSRLLK